MIDLSHMDLEAAMQMGQNKHLKKGDRKHVKIILYL